MIIPVMAILNLVLTQQIYSEETNGAHAHNRDRVPLMHPLTWFFTKTSSIENGRLSRRASVSPVKILWTIQTYEERTVTSHV